MKQRLGLVLSRSTAVLHACSADFAVRDERGWCIMYCSTGDRGILELVLLHPSSNSVNAADSGLPASRGCCGRTEYGGATTFGSAVPRPNALLRGAEVLRVLVAACALGGGAEGRFYWLAELNGGAASFGSAATTDCPILGPGILRSS
ncbi:hypothetical protein DIPPA_10676 [Diplonema papillatum]|nr:hypothetical protein DIPPA_10676 [Diplonema papillatum]